MAGVRGFERIGELNADVDAFADFYPALAHEELERAPVDILHSEKWAAIFALAHFINDANIGMIEAGSGFGFRLKTLALIRVLRQFERHQLDGNETFQASVPGKKHLTHSALADLADHAIM